MWLAEFRETFPNVKVLSDIGVTHELLKDLEDDKFDLVIASAGYTAMANTNLPLRSKKPACKRKQ